MCCQKLTVECADQTLKDQEQQNFAQKMDETIKQHLADPNFGAEQLAESMNLSKSQLFRKCCILVDDSPGKYLLGCRLLKATDLLKETNEPVKNVAWSCGFLTYSGFWKAFHSVYKRTPTDYRLDHQSLDFQIVMTWSMPPIAETKGGLAYILRQNPLVLRFFRLMLNDLSNEHLRLDVIAELFNISASQLSRNLKCTLGVTPMKLLQHVRLLKAAELLSCPSKSIAEISNCTGFFDQSHLCHCFKAAFGCSPRDYRKTGRKEGFMHWLRDLLAELVEVP